MTTVKAIVPFVPAKDFEESTRFYAALGFSCPAHDDGVRSFQMGGHGFLLQDFYVKKWADNFMMNIHVDDAAGFIESIRPAIDEFAHARVQEPELEDWGMIVGYIWDPTGVLWHVTQTPD